MDTQFNMVSDQHLILSFWKALIEMWRKYLRTRFVHATVKDNTQASTQNSSHFCSSAAGKPPCLRRAATHEVSYGLEGEGRIVYYMRSKWVNYRGLDERPSTNLWGVGMRSP